MIVETHPTNQLIQTPEPGRDATVRRPALDAPEGEWFRYVYIRDNPMGPHDEWWTHSAGCRQWFVVSRDTRTHEILGSAPPGRTPGQATR